MASSNIENLTRLRAVRGGNRAVVTKLTKEADSLLDESPPDLVRIDSIERQLDLKVKLLEDLDSRILEICDVEAVTDEIEESGVFLDKIFLLKSKLDYAKTQHQISNDHVQSSHQQLQITSTGASEASAKPKLQKLELPKFRGDITTYFTFWDSFNSAIHTNPHIANIDKFHYLKASLEGSAAESIQGLTLTSANYDAAVDLLRERYGNKQQIISAHMDQLLKISCCTSDKAQPLRSLYDKINVHTRGLASLGVSSKEYGSLLIPIIMSKLPNEVRVEVSRKVNSEVWMIEDLLEAMKAEIQAREASERVKTAEPIKRPTPATTSAFFTRERNESSKGFTIRCVYCKSNHYSASCDKVTSTTSRKDILRNANRCFVCLKTGHRAFECNTNKNCRHCNKRHHQSICGKDNSNKKTENVTTTLNRNKSEKSTKSCKRGGGTVLLQTARTVAENFEGTKSANVRILFDNGSQRSYVTNNLKSRLNLKPEKHETLHLNTFGENKFRKQDCDVVKLTLQSLNGENIKISAVSFPVICTPLTAKVETSNFPYLQGLELADHFSGCNENDPIDVLIGSDYYWDIVTGPIIRQNSGPTALESKFGWLLSGHLYDSIASSTNIVSNLIISGNCCETEFLSSQNEELTDTLKRFWETESIGIREFDDHELQRNSQMFPKEIRRTDSRYEVKLPWKENCPVIPNNFELCRNRLKSMFYKLRKEPEVLQEYDNIIKDQLEKGIIEEVPADTKTDTCENTDSEIHYMPHHAVIRKDRDTTKLRVVYDGSAKKPGETHSLNDCLETGPNYIPHMFNVLVKFRSNPIAMSADIEKAFLMIGINEVDKNMLRFLWFKDPFILNSEFIQLRFCRLVFGLRPSPAILGATIDHHLNSFKDKYPEIVQQIKQSLYVDDFVSGTQTIDEAINLYKKSKSLMADGGFNLRKWHTNSALLNAEINSDENKRNVKEIEGTPQNIYEEDESYTKSTVGPCNTSASENFVKVLGVIWETETDEILFDFNELINYAKSLPVTKRSLLKLTAKIFDPLGLLSAFTVQMKCLFQTFCIDKLEWDTELQGNYLNQWITFLNELESLNKVCVPRCYYNANRKPENVQLHCFSDASKKAYGGVIYLRTCYDDGQVSVRLVTAKTKVAPIKQQSIPRLELLGATVLARLVSSTINALATPNLNETTLWIDSTTVLYWIKNEKPWKQYVQHRVREIRQLTNKGQWQWKYCPGKINPADLASRGVTGKELVNNSLWWNGPEFLLKPESEWPTFTFNQVDETAMHEIVKCQPQTVHSLVNHAQLNSCDLNKVIDLNKFSSLTKLLRVTAYILRFIEVLKHRRLNRIQEQSKKSHLQASEIERAENLWIKTIQTHSFSEEKQFLTSNHKSTPPTLICQFGLYLDVNAIIRCKGRINNSTLSTSDKNPILLPKNHTFTELLIRHTHEKIKHSGIRDTLTTVREEYWILRGREAVKKVLRKCVVCRKLEGYPYRPCSTPDLPAERVSDAPPFTHTGLDFAGPLYISSGSKTSTKSYICLFTCASTRAIHLELTRELSVNQFLQAFRRFTSRRGLPATLISDNAKTFTSASKEISKIIRSQELQSHLANNKITWKFIVEKAPWWGGFWERLIQTVKKSIRKTVGRANLDYDELNTILVEIESIINARPITYVYDDKDSTSYALTPSHLISGRRITTMPNNAHFEIVSTFNSLTKRDKHLRHLLNRFTQQWKHEYL